MHLGSGEAWSASNTTWREAMKRMRWSSTIAATLLISGALAGRAPAQVDFEEEDDGSARREMLLKLIEDMQSREAAAPSVLGDLDLRQASAEVRKAARVLRETKVSLSLEKESFEDALDLLRRLSGLSFVISAKARKALAEEKPQLTFTLRELPLENLLNLIAIQHPSYRFTLRYGAVMLLHADEYRPAKVLRVYDVRDIVRPRRHFAAPQLGLAGSRE
jgi:hypothetical protein